MTSVTVTQNVQQVIVNETPEQTVINDARQGAQGVQGDTGATGATGAQGPAGNDGADGADGASGRFTTVSVEYNKP